MTSFGTEFTTHMVVADWDDEHGWSELRVEPLAPLSLHPATAVLHYGQEIFEGLKLYRQPDDSIAAFRPERNARRMQYSAERLVMPPVPIDTFLESIGELAGVDRGMVPSEFGHSLYLRPFQIASEPFLGVRASRKSTYCVIGSPVGPYFSDAASGLTLWLSTTVSRAGDGGTGAAKCGGNYASSLIALREAQQNGCDQALFTDAATHSWVEEAGAMNIFFVFSDGSVVTPPAAGSILDGVTRASVVELARDYGHDVVERPISVDEWRDAAESGHLAEVFTTGTAATITPVRCLVAPDDKIQTPGLDGFGPLGQRLRDELASIQYGTLPDRFGWMRPLTG